ncbi:MAG: leucyl aminopeptidase [Planctomycetota bacterium]|jgi:leucyl aminopeptidase|nr:MAG: leucyl aminopeptidase [Planctomycetota bacterium]
MTRETNRADRHAEFSLVSPQATAGAIVAEPATRPEKITADAVVLFLTEGGIGGGAAAELDRATGGLITRLAAAGEITGKRHECVPLLAAPGLEAGQLLVVGLGKREEVECGVLYRAAATAARHLAGRPRTKVVFVADGWWSARQVEQAVAGAAVGMVGQDLYRAEPRRIRFGATVWTNASPETVRTGATIADGVNLARRLVNTPPDDLYPQSFAEEAAAVAGRTGMEIEIWDEERLRRERCEAMLAVGRGSSRPPRLVILRYRGPGRDAGARSPRGDAPDLALVGKGVTFDSGGLSLKPSDSMLSMKCDMAGGAAVLAATATIAALRLPVHVVAAIGLVENMTGPAAYKLGDVITARSGTTIEVHNTDAEGRVVLADVLDVVRELQPRAIVDAATLTGACMVALGQDVAGLFSNDQPWCDTLAAAARAVGEPVWQLPMYADYDEHIKSEVADIKNVGDGRWGGAITAAKFLERFVGGIPWTHVDIAGPAFAEKSRPWTDGGATGAMVRPFVELVRGPA